MFIQTQKYLKCPILEALKRITNGLGREARMLDRIFSCLDRSSCGFNLKDLLVVVVEKGSRMTSF